MLWVNQITLVSYLFRSCVVFHLTAQNWRQPFWQYVNLFQITRYLDDFRIFDTNMFSSSSESTNCPYLWACQNHIMTVLQCSNEILRILPQQIVYFISPKNLWWPPYTICGPRSLCRPSTLHHLNQLRRFARPSRLLTKFAYLAKTHMLHIRRLATRRHGDTGGDSLWVAQALSVIYCKAQVCHSRQTNCTEPLCWLQCVSCSILPLAVTTFIHQVQPALTETESCDLYHWIMTTTRARLDFHTGSESDSTADPVQPRLADMKNVPGKHSAPVLRVQLSSTLKVDATDSYLLTKLHGDI
jgi:hypothetical protein